MEEKRKSVKEVATADLTRLYGAIASLNIKGLLRVTPADVQALNASRNMPTLMPSITSGGSITARSPITLA
jgi:hypothetical protein